MDKVPGWVKSVGPAIAVIATLVGMGVLILPWNAATKEEMGELDRRNQTEHNSIEKSLVRVEAKLDMIIQHMGVKNE